MRVLCDANPPPMSMNESRIPCSFRISFASFAIREAAFP